MLVIKTAADKLAVDLAFAVLEHLQYPSDASLARVGKGVCCRNR